MRLIPSYIILDMLSVYRCREILDKTTEGMTDLEIKELQNIFIVLSDLAIDTYLTKRKCISDENNYENLSR